MNLNFTIPLEIMIFIGVAGIFLITFIIFYKRIKRRVQDLVHKKWIRVYILTTHGGTYKEADYLRVSNNLEDFEHKGRKYTIDKDKAILQHDNTLVLYYEQEKAQPLQMRGSKYNDNSRIIKNMVKLARIKGLLASGREIHFFILLGVLVCAVVGISIYTIWSNQQMHKEFMMFIENVSRRVW